MGHPGFMQRLSGADGRIYTVSTVPVLTYGPYNSQIWETKIWESRGCLFALGTFNTRYREYTFDEDQARQEHESSLEMVQLGHKPMVHDGQDLAANDPPGSWRMTGEEIRDAKRSMRRIIRANL